MLIDFEAPIYTQADLLKMLTDIKPKQLQNWSERGILDAGDQKPGKGSRRRYTPAGVIALDFIQRLTEFGVPPLAARSMSDDYLEAARDFLEAGPDVITREDGCRWIPITEDRMAHYRRAYIIRVGDGDYFMMVEGDTFLDDLGLGINRLTNTFGIFIELDFMVSMAVNRMFLLEAGVI